MISLRKATEEDIQGVMQDLSGISSSELQRAGYTADEALHNMRMMLEQHGGTAILSEGLPVAVVIATKPDGGISQTCFIAKSAFFSSGSRFTVALRRWVHKTLEEWPLGTVMRSITFSEHPQVHKWYRVLGYIPTGENGLGKCFEIARRAPTASDPRRNFISTDPRRAHEVS